MRFAIRFKDQNSFLYQAVNMYNSTVNMKKNEAFESCIVGNVGFNEWG